MYISIIVRSECLSRLRLSMQDTKHISVKINVAGVIRMRRFVVNVSWTWKIGCLSQSHNLCEVYFQQLVHYIVFPYISAGPVVLIYRYKSYCEHDCLVQK